MKLFFKFFLILTLVVKSYAIMVKINGKTNLLFNNQLIEWTNENEPIEVNIKYIDVEQLANLLHNLLPQYSKTVSMDNFFIAYEKTALGKNSLLLNVPHNMIKRIQKFVNLLDAPN